MKAMTESVRPDRTRFIIVAARWREKDEEPIMIGLLLRGNAKKNRAFSLVSMPPSLIYCHFNHLNQSDVPSLTMYQIET